MGFLQRPSTTQGGTAGPFITNNTHTLKKNNVKQDINNSNNNTGKTAQEKFKQMYIFCISRSVNATVGISRSSLPQSNKHKNKKATVHNLMMLVSSVLDISNGATSLFYKNVHGGGGKFLGHTKLIIIAKCATTTTKMSFQCPCAPLKFVLDLVSE